MIARAQETLDLAVLGLIEHAPGASACITDEHRTIARSVAGLRRVDLADPLTAEHAMHIGSCAKSMTAAMIARAVEAGSVSWTDPIADVLGGPIDSALSELTLVDLLAHRAGLPPLEEDEEVDRLPEFSGDGVAQRAALARHVLEAGPVGPVGEFRYSNAGFAVATSVVERATGWRWEDEMATMFDDLWMDAGVGWPSRDDAWGHVVEGDRLVPVDPDGGRQIEPWLAVAGDVHATAEAMAIWLRQNLSGTSDGTSMLSADSWSRLHGLDDGVGLGWGRQAFRGRPVSVHSGSAGTFFTLTLLDHDARLGVVVLLNASTPDAQDAAVAMLRETVDRFPVGGS